MAYDPTPHLMKVRGGQMYLQTKDRLVWLREENPDAVIKTEMVRLDLDVLLAVFRAEVTLPNGASATGYGSETERDFPAGWIEKAETKALGRALAALGFGTQFAQELDEDERRDPTHVAPNPPPSLAPTAPGSATPQPGATGFKQLVEADLMTADTDLPPDHLTEMAQGLWSVIHHCDAMDHLAEVWQRANKARAEGLITAADLKELQHEKNRKKAVLDVPH